MRYKLIYLFLILSLFPFISPIPLASDLQPISGLLAIFLIIRYSVHKKMTTYSELLAYLFLFISSFYLIQNVYIDDVNISKHFSYVYGVVVFIAFKKFNFYNTSVFKISLYIYFLVFLIYIIFPDLYSIINTNMVYQRGLDTTDSLYILNYRGVAILANEPSFFGSILGFFLLLNHRLYFIYQENKTTYFIHLLLIVILLFFNKSGTGFVFLVLYIIYLFIEMPFSYKKLIILISSILVFYTFSFLTLSSFASSNRYLDLFFKFKSGTISSDVALDRRLTDFFYGFIYIKDNPIGSGTGKIDNVIQEYYFQTGNLDPSKEAFISSLSNGLVSYGIFMLVFILTVFYESKSSWIEKVFAFLMLSFSLSFGFPLTWALLTFKNYNYENLRNRRSWYDRLWAS